VTDQQIIDLLLQRNESGIEEAERQYGKRLIRIAETLLSKEDAEECVNDVFLALWNHVPQGESTVLFPYLVRILKNKACSRWRTQKTAKRRMEMIPFSEETIMNLSDPRADTESEAILSATDVINRFLSKQRASKREMFVLRYWYGLSIKDIAERYGCSYAKAEKTLNRMKKDLQEEIRK